MEPFYTLLFAILSGAIILLEWPRASTVVGVKAATPAALPPAFVSFRNNYLVVYSLMMGASAPLKEKKPGCQWPMYLHTACQG